MDVRIELRLVPYLFPIPPSYDEKLLGALTASAVPDVEERITIDGEPYVVHTREWTVVTDNPRFDVPGRHTNCWCVVRVMRPASWQPVVPAAADAEATTPAAAPPAVPAAAPPADVASLRAYIAQLENALVWVRDGALYAHRENILAVAKEGLRGAT